LTASIIGVGPQMWARWASLASLFEVQTSVFRGAAGWQTKAIDGT
jgi:hypothetical protein